MAQRLTLHELLVSLLGSTNVYYQPPENIKLNYPCIVYNLDNDFVIRADNRVYHRRMRYQVTHITRDPDGSIYDEVIDVPYASLERTFVADGLHHMVYNIYH